MFHNETAPTEDYTGAGTLSLHVALPILLCVLSLECILCMIFAFRFLDFAFLLCPSDLFALFRITVFDPLPVSSTTLLPIPFLDWMHCQMYVCLYFLCLLDSNPACFVMTTLNCDSLSKAPSVFYICERLNLLDTLQNTSPTMQKADSGAFQKALAEQGQMLDRKSVV